MDDVWVVMACRKGSQENFWAWCRPRRDSPGFDEIFYTMRDGVTAWSPSGDDLPILAEHLFTIVFPGQQEAAPTGDRFPHQPIEWDPVPEPSWSPVEPPQVDVGNPG